MLIKRYFIWGSFLLLPTTLFAQVITDNTLGSKITHLEGPDYQIDASLGQQAGNNLFHSFQEFNLEVGESATFSGANTIENVISRVTGGNPSYIDGTIRSSIPNADFYFINPYGMMFGPNAMLDVQGSFHASTADYLSLGNDGYFDARNPESSLLTVAPVEAFGFLNHQPGAITIEGSFLKVTKNNTLSLIGGEITSKDGTLFAESGQINLVSMASPGKVDLTSPDLLTTSVKLGKIMLSQFGEDFQTRDIKGEDWDIANVDVSGQRGGKIFIRASELLLDRALMFANIDEDGNQPPFIDISINGDLRLTKGSQITADNNGNDLGGHITINTTGILEISGMNEDAFNPEYFFDHLSRISTNAWRFGTGGNIYINASSLILNPGLIQANTVGLGHAGDIEVIAQQMLLNYGEISAATNSPAAAGNITLNAEKSISLLNMSRIATLSGFSNEGGNIEIKTSDLNLDKSAISSQSAGTGNAGSIDITTDTAYLINESGITTEAEHARGGHVNLTSNNELHLLNSIITTQARGSNTQDSGGNITISKPGLFTLKNSSKLLANAYGGNGGNINIQSNDFIGNNSQIDVSSRLGLNGQFQVNGIEFQENYSLLPDKISLITTLVACPPLSDQLSSRFNLKRHGGLFDLPGQSRSGSLLNFSVNDITQ